MAENRITIDAPPERVFDVLADASCYAEWVVGASEVRDADDGWPQPGTKLHHSIGLGPLSLNDHTKVVSSEPPRQLVLQAEVRPLGTFRVSLDLRAAGTGTHVTMREHAVAGPLRLGGPATDIAVRARNTLSLRRLKDLAEHS